MADAVVGKRDDVVRRIGNAAELAPGFHAVVVLTRAVFVIIIAEFYHGIHALALGDVIVSVEIAGGIKRAGDEGENHILDVAVRQGLSAAERRNGFAGVEAVEILGARPKILRDYFDGVIAGCIGGEYAARRDVPESGIACDLPCHRNWT